MIGEPFHIEACMGGFAHPGYWWRSDKRISGGAFYDWGAHICDWVLGLVPSRIKEVSGHFLETRVWHDVTNEEYFRFVTAGGYREPSFWPESLVIDGGPVPWDTAMTRFVDQTGLNGPRFWSDGTYPDGKHDHPVVGVSWYEAMAYARWAGKELPGLEQWWRAALGGTDAVFPWGNDVMTTQLRANFGMKGTQAVGSLPLGIGPFGCFEMAGNVREWVGGLESVNGLRAVVGGSWKTPSYMFEASYSESFEAGYARDDIGFRCAKTVTGD
jgi:formylglycine-generating enzyme required for sulfatase activity